MGTCKACKTPNIDVRHMQNTETKIGWDVCQSCIEEGGWDELPSGVFCEAEGCGELWSHVVGGFDLCDEHKDEAEVIIAKWLNLYEE